MYYMYVLKSLKDYNLYWGYTNDLRRRVHQHQRGGNTSTKHRRPFKLVYYEAYSSRGDAMNRERQIKKRGNAYMQLKKRIIESIDGPERCEGDGVPIEE